MEKLETENVGGNNVDAALIEIAAIAEKVLGTRELAESWISQPALALNGKRPMDLLTTTPGIEVVKALLTRLEFGVYG